MASLKVEIISREMIKPSSPTPDRLKTLQLSFIDQMAPPLYISLIFFYHKDPSHPINPTELSNLLKKSLSDTLVRFYPLAGRIEGNTSIDCNDQGAEYYETNAASDLSDVIENPNPEDLRELLPFDPTIPSSRTTILGVQVNHFSCGGVAITLCVSHKIADGAAATTFANAWATETLISSRGLANTNIDDYNALLENKTNPKFDSASQFPPRGLSGIFTPEASIRREKVVTKRLVFDQKKIDMLKLQAVQSKDTDDYESSQVKDPTRVEVVSAFIWDLVMKANNRGKLDPTKVSVAAHVADLRTRRAPPISKDSFGNFWWFTTTHPLIGGEAKHPEMVAMLRQAIRKIDNDYIKTIENGECLSELKKMLESPPLEGIMESCSFSSWCRFPLYEADFGWGKPEWVSTATSPFKNMVILLSTKCGKGIEAWVNMLEDDIGMHEHDHELISLATPTVGA